MSVLAVAARSGILLHKYSAARLVVPTQVGGFIVCTGIGLVVAGGQFYGQQRLNVHQIEVQRVSGCVVSRIVARNGSSRFIFATNKRSMFERARRFRVTWRHAPVELTAGGCWNLSLRLKPLRGTRNEIGFDYERWLFSQRLNGLASVRSEIPTLLPGTSANAAYLAVRETVFRRVVNLTSGHSSSALIVALAVGIRDGLSERDWDVLKRSGTAHLMAISGLHIGLAAMLGYWIGRYLPVRLNVSTNLIGRGAFTALLVAASYAAVAGFAVSTLRALVMLSLWFFWRLTHRSVHVSTTLLLTIASVLLIHPWMAAQTGFWLSAGAVAAISAAVYGRPPAVSFIEKLRLALRIQFGLTLLMLPISVLVAGGISWISIPVNLILIPLFSVCIVPLVLLLLLTLLVVPSMAAKVVMVLGPVLDALWFAVVWLAEQPWAYTPVTSMSLWLTLPVFVCGLMLLLPPGFPARWISMVLVLPLFFVRAEQPALGEFRLDVLDVGQALAVVMQTRSHTVVYDTGNAWPGGDSALQTVLPFLRARRVDKLHTLVVSHADRDHAGGAISLAQEAPARNLWVGEPVEGLSNASVCVSGMQWQLDGVRFEFLHPPPDSPYEGNQQSCVLLVAGKGATALLTGDLGGALERRLLPELADRSVDLVVGAHHGSLTSSDPLFVRRVQSRFIVFSNGYGNQWGMPRDKIVERWSGAGTEVLTTALDGQVRFESTNNGPLRLTYRAREPGLGVWRWRP